MKTCVFAGTFDPITKGHEFVIRKCLEIFDKVVVAVGVNVDKTPAFTREERVQMIKLAFLDDARVQVETFDRMLVDFMKEKGLTVNVRGLRNEDDYKYETTMERYNKDAYPSLTTIYIPTPKELVHISSSAMRNILGLNGSVEEYVPKKVFDYIEELKKNKR